MHVKCRLSDRVRFGPSVFRPTPTSAAGSRGVVRGRSSRRRGARVPRAQRLGGSLAGGTSLFDNPADVPVRLDDPSVIERRRHGSQRPNRGAQPSGSPPGEPTLGSILVSRARANTKDRPDAQVCVAARYALMAALAPMSRGPVFASVSAATIERWTLVDARWTSEPPIVAPSENGNRS